MRALSFVFIIILATLCHAGEPPQSGSKPFNLSHIKSRFVAGFVAKPRQLLKSPFGRLAIQTAFRGEEADQAMKMFSDQFGMSIDEVEQCAILFSERNIAAINGIDLPSVGGPTPASATRIKNNLKQLALATHNFHDVYNRFPGFTPPGKGKLSWRVHILPYMEELALYEKFDLDEDWDSETNKPLIDQMPEIFKTPGVRDAGKTAYHLTELAFPIAEKNQFRDFVDGSSNTVMHILAGSDKAVEWTKPSRLEVEDGKAWEAVGNVPSSLYVSMTDGSSRAIREKNTSDEKLLAMFTRNGGEPIGWDELARNPADPMKQPTFVIHTTESIDQKRILAMVESSFGEAKKKRGNGQAYYDFEGYAIWFPTETSLVATPTTMLPAVMSKRQKTSLFRETLAANSKADFVGVFDIKGMPRIYAVATAGYPSEMPRSLTHIENIIGVLNVSDADSPLFRMAMSLKDAKSARNVAAMLNGILAFASEAELNNIFFGTPDELSTITQQVLRKLRETDITQDGSNLEHVVPRPAGFADAMKPWFEQVGDTFRREQQRAKEYALKGKMKEIGLAFHNHHDVYRSFGAADGSTADGRKSGLSWRVHLLPFLGEAQLYEQFKLDEQWDSEHNKKLIAKMPDVFKVKGVEEAGKTSVHVLLGNTAPFKDGKTEFRIDDCIDGTSMTILAIVAGPDKAEVWTKPGGIEIGDDPRNSLGKLSEKFQVLLTDGSVHFLSSDLNIEVLKALMTNAGRELIQYDDFIKP